MHVSFQDGKFNASYHNTAADRGMIFDRHAHPHFEIVVVLNGKITMAIENKRYTVSPQSVVVFTPSTFHSLFVNEPTQYERMTVSFAASEIPSEIYTDFLQKANLFPVLQGGFFTRFCEDAKAVLSANDKDRLLPLWRAMMIRLFYAVAFFEGDTEQNVSTEKNLTAIIDYINVHVAEKFGLEEVANSVFLSKSSISHLFKNKMKISFKQYVLQKKMAYATRLMLNGVSAGEAAKTIGYENYSNFYSVYKKIVGVPPSDKKKS